MPPHQRSPKREPSPPPQLLREAPQTAVNDIQMSWDDAQASFSRGGSPLPFLDPSVCDDILADIRQPDGTFPDFGSIPSQPSSPPPQLEVARINKATQSQPHPSQDVGTQAMCRPHQGTSETQTPSPPSSSDRSTQVLIRPSRSVAYTQTARPATSTTASWTQTSRPALRSIGTGMPPVLSTSTGIQAGSFYDNELIPPGVPRPRLPWAYSYAQFDALLISYPDIHPEDFVSFGVFQAQPRRGSFLEWGDVTGVLAHMAGGKRALADELHAIIGRIRRLDQNDPMRVVEEQALVAVVIRERRRSRVPLGDGAYATLAAPGGPLGPGVTASRHSSSPWPFIVSPATPYYFFASTGTLQGSGSTPIQGLTWAHWGPRWPSAYTPRLRRPHRGQ